MRFMVHYEIASGALGAIVGIVTMTVILCTLAMVAEALIVFTAGIVYIAQPLSSKAWQLDLMIVRVYASVAAIWI